MKKYFCEYHIYIRKETRDFIWRSFISNEIKYPVLVNDLKIINFQLYKSLIKKTHFIEIYLYLWIEITNEKISFSIPLNNVQITSINPFHSLWENTCSSYQISIFFLYLWKQILSICIKHIIELMSMFV